MSGLLTEPNEAEFDCDGLILEEIIKQKILLVDELLKIKAKQDSHCCPSTETTLQKSQLIDTGRNSHIKEVDYPLSPGAEALYEELLQIQGSADIKNHILTTQKREFQAEIASLKSKGGTISEILKSIGNWEMVKNVLLQGMKNESDDIELESVQLSAKEHRQSDNGSISPTELKEKLKEVVQFLKVEIVIHQFQNDETQAFNRLIFSSSASAEEILHIYSNDRYYSIFSLVTSDGFVADDQVFVSGDRKYKLASKAHYFDIAIACIEANRPRVIRKIKEACSLYNFINENEHVNSEFLSRLVWRLALAGTSKEKQDSKLGSQQITERHQQVSQNSLTTRLDSTKAISLLTTINSKYKRDFMIYLTKYRKWYVDNLVLQLNSKCQNLLFTDLGSGSLDPTSDYDTSFGAKAGNILDVWAVRQLNDYFIRNWGNLPGSVLDTNFYVKEFTIQQRLDKDRVGSAFQDRPTPFPQDFFFDANCVKQHQMALVKQRIYSSQEEWDLLVKEILAECRTQAEAKDIKALYDNANRLYLKCIIRVLHKLGMNKNAFRVQLEDDSRREIIPSRMSENYHGTPKETYTMKEALELEQLYKWLECELPLLIRQQRNEIYLELNSYFKSLVKAHRTIKRSFKSRDLLPREIKEDLDAIVVQIRHVIGISSFFGNEMYLSEGAKSHVGSELRENKADGDIENRKHLRLNNLTNSQLVASVNEQFGDFLKDIHSHLKTPGDAFYRSSKYLLRLFRACEELCSGKTNRLNLRGKELPKVNGLDASSLRKEINQVLYKIRKGSEGKWALASNAHKAQTAAKEVKRIFDADTTDQYVALIRRYVIKINLGAFRNSRAWKFYELIGNLSFFLKLRNERPEKFTVPLTYDKKSYQQVKKRIYSDRTLDYLKGSDLSTRIMTLPPNSFVKNLIPINFIGGTFGAMLVSLLIFLISGTIKNLFLPFLLIYSFLKARRPTAKPADRLGLELSADIKAIRSSKGSIYEVHYGEIEDTLVPIGHVYNNSGCFELKMIASLRILSTIFFILMPWLPWMANVMNLVRCLTIRDDAYIPLALIGYLRMCGLIVNQLRGLIDFYLWIKLSSLHQEAQRKYSKTKEVYQAIRSEYKRYRAKSIANLIGLLFNISFISLLILPIRQNGGGWIEMIAGSSGIQINLGESIQISENTLRWIVMPFIISIIYNTLVELVAVKFRGNLEIDNVEHLFKIHT